jgi:ribose transport system permease protein
MRRRSLVKESLDSVTPRPDLSARDIAGTRARRTSVNSLASKWAGPALLLAMIIGFTIALPGVFLTSSNLVAVVNNQAIAAIVALGLLFPLAAGVFDISIGGVITLSVISSASMFQATSGRMPVIAVIVVTLLAGSLAGFVNGLLVVRLQIDPFIVTLGTGSVFLGLSQLVANGKAILGIPNPIVCVIVLAAIVYYVLEHTPLGRMIYATGAGREASRLAGVPTDHILYLAFWASAFCAALAGLVYTARIGTGQPDVGGQYLLPCYAAAFLGSTMIKPGRFNVPGLLVGLAIIAIGINGLQLWGIPFWVISTFQGGALVLAVVLTKIRKTPKTT